MESSQIKFTQTAMKAAVFHGTKNIKIENLNLPRIKPDEILVKVAVCGVCGTDLHIYNGAKGSAPVIPPVILGHEFSGQIVETGTAVRRLKVGDRICINPNIHCGSCDFCHAGKIHLCENLRAIGVTQNGGFAEYAIVPQSAAHRLPENVSYEEGAMGEPLACCLHGADLAGVKHGDTVLIIGGGTIGLMMVQLAQLAGAAQIFVSEPIKEKWPLAKSFGADVLINPATGDLTQQVREKYPSGADVVFECVGLAATMRDAVAAGKRGGTVMLFGLASPETEIVLRPLEIFQKEQTIKSSFINPNTQSRAISLLSSGRVNVKQFFADILPLEKLESVLDDAEITKRGKILIRP